MKRIILLLAAAAYGAEFGVTAGVGSPLEVKVDYSYQGKHSYSSSRETSSECMYGVSLSHLVSHEKSPTDIEFKVGMLANQNLTLAQASARIVFDCGDNYALLIGPSVAKTIMYSIEADLGNDGSSYFEHKVSVSDSMLFGPSAAVQYTLDDGKKIQFIADSATNSLQVTASMDLL
ncbi:hypothetical protein [Candidatus Synchoanobacter obligatus]|uniref:Uncharacterized protein n=1 Tax=Candidatus Synchoanobacter obligatus TaxID=2919597 RepID=A0ABT1L730_9GAMM|nr:hypothetical protein [Candidatus Synchoanobacter obligatus]MCP8352578.1 hypothetical protein [Candidatus Synchoanobacter obligatus]